MIATAGYGHTKAELDYFSSFGEYTHFPHPRGGAVELATFAEVCANRITTGFQVADYVENNPDTHWTIPFWIKYVVRASELGMAVTVAALILIERYQKVLAELDASEVYEVEGVCRIFLSAYMVAAKVIHNDEEPPMSYWIRVSRRRYCHDELFTWEREFLEVINWRVDIDRGHQRSTLVNVIQAYDMLQTQRLMARMKNPPIKSIYFNKQVVEEIPMLDREDEDLFRQAVMSPEGR